MWFLKSKQHEDILPPPPPHAIIDEENKTESKKELIAKKVKVKKKELKKSAYGGQIKKSNKPKEVLEAEEEIKSAIDKIKEKEKISFFKKFFPIKQSSIEKPMKETFVDVLPELDNISMIQNKINEAKQALMKFDLESAKRGYIDILKMYNNIKPEEQDRVYQDVRDLYFERKSAEELKV